MVPELLRDDIQTKRAIVPYAAFHEASFVLASCDQKVVLLHQRHGPAAEQFRRLATRLANRHATGTTLMVTSPAPEDGKTLTSVNLALALSERAPVLLIDLDTRRSQLRNRLGLPPVHIGIEDVLAEQEPPELCVQSIAGTRLSLALNKGNGTSLLDLLTTGRPRRFLDWAQRRFPWVILDTPPAFPIADTLEIANHVATGMLVVRARKTPAPLVKRAIEVLKGRIQYVVLNDCEAITYSACDPSYYFQSDNK